MRRRLGQRFQEEGRERSAMSGFISIGGEHQPVQITRTQDDDGERVAVGLGNGPTLFSWTADEGVTSGGSVAAAADRSVIERLVFDSPDQFLQAQLRMASYYVIARNVMPGEARGSDDYEGPVWDVVRVSEPPKSEAGRPLSSSRLYYINASTGLIDKVAYEELGETIVAELSGWSSQGGEMSPGRIVWSRNKQVVMELVVSSVSHGPRQ